MKKVIVMVVLIFGVIFASFAQKQPTAEELAKKNVEELEKRLKLTPTQKGVIYNYAFNLAKEQLALYKKQQANGYNDEETTKYYRIHNKTNTDIKVVLKPEQVIEYDKIVEERLNGVDPNKKKKKKKKGEEEEKVVGIEGLKIGNN
ncbi:MAG: hypothetical protein EOO90_10760 [Pedobacter sp.]|nr:MAG: hypothetical protein EOO90_10760 [Pedobacter sp.]